MPLCNIVLHDFTMVKGTKKKAQHRYKCQSRCKASKLYQAVQNARDTY